MLLLCVNHSLKRFGRIHHESQMLSRLPPVPIYGQIGRVIAPSWACSTVAAYFAITPVV
jgi:hypothetical protein